MKRRGAGLVGAMIILCAWTAWGAPLDEIRRILRDRALHPATEPALSALQEETLNHDLKDLDPYARHIPVRDYRSPSRGSGVRVGIGAELIKRDGRVLLSVYSGEAAHRAGIPDRSRLLAVGGHPVQGRDVQGVADLLRGEAGEPVRLLVLTPEGEKQTFQVTREPFRPPAVETVEVEEGHIIRIRQFQSGLTRNGLRATLLFLSRKGRSETDPVILDLRDATGGDLYEAFDTAAMFLAPGSLLGTMVDRNKNRRDFVSPEGEKKTMPLALVIGPDTASAAEIFAGALQQNGRGVLVGQPSYGKCSSQTDVPLSDGSVLRFTNSEVLLPDGDSCSGKGLQPDLKINDAEQKNLSLLLKEVMHSLK